MGLCTTSLLLSQRLHQVSSLHAPSSVHPKERRFFVRHTREKGKEFFQRLLCGSGLRVAASFCSWHAGLPFFCVMLILLANWTNYGPFYIPVYESIGGRSTNATM